MVALGGFMTAVGAAIGALISKVLPAWGQYLKDHAAADAERHRADVAAQQAAAAILAEKAKTEAAIQNEREKMAAALKHEMYDKVYEEFRELLNRHEREAARRDGLIDAQDRRIETLYSEIKRLNNERMEVAVKNEKLLAEVMILRAQLETNRKVESAVLLPTRVDALVVIDQNGIIREWSPAATAMFNWRQVDAVGKSVDLIIPPDLRGGHHKGFQEMITTGRDVKRGPYRTEGVRQDGSRVPVEITLSSWNDQGVRFVSANISPLVPGSDGEMKAVGTLAASSESLLNAVRTIADRRPSGDPADAPAAAQTTVIAPDATSVQVKAETVNVGVHTPETSKKEGD
jgi:PAS domain S-box-containing protein